jgi:hypothetical protein
MSERQKRQQTYPTAWDDLASRGLDPRTGLPIVPEVAANGDGPWPASPALSADGWPVLGEDAYHGLVGRFLEAVEGTTEADPVGVLVTFLAEFGAAVGPGPHLFQANVRHPGRIMPVLVGETAKARKGTAKVVAETVLREAAPEFFDRCARNGFNSAEAVVDAVADPDAEEGSTVHLREPRLLWVETELARLLRVCHREGSVVSQVIRNAYDGETLEVRSRAKTTVARHHHIVLIGQISSEELRANLASSEIAGGFANRLLFVQVRRQPGLVPFDANVPEATVAQLGRSVAAMLDASTRIERMHWRDDTRPLWAALYRQMAEDDPPGLLGSIVARPETQVMRLAVIYALLDGEALIRPEHLRAAWAVWQYARTSAELIFGDLSGDPDVDRLLAELRRQPDGLDANELDRMFGGHGKGARVRARAEQRGLVTTIEVRTEGRSRKVSVLAGKAGNAGEGGAR